MNRKWICMSVVGIILMSVLMAGCGGGTAGISQAAKPLRIVTGPEPETLDPRISSGNPEANIQYQLFEGLCSRDKDGAILPGVAEKWEVAPDGITYKFYLRANAKWSNGDPVTAQDFEFAWKTALLPETASKYAEMLYPIKNAKACNKGSVGMDQVGVKAVNDKTLEVVLESPTAYFLSLTTYHTYYPVHKKTVEADPKWAGDAKSFVGNGPFKMVAWSHNSKIEAVKNEHYWDAAKVKTAKLDMILSDNAKTAMDMFENNQAEIVELTPPVAEIPRLLKENKLHVIPHIGTYYFLFNTKQAPFDQVKVRKALALAINREMLVEKVTRSGEKAALAFIPYDLPDATPKSDFRKVGGLYIKDNDVETAKKLLAEAGYPDGKGFPEVTILYNTSDLHKNIAEAIQEMWKKNLNINVGLTNQEWKVYLQSIKQGGYQVARRGWVVDYMDPMGFFSIMMTGDTNNCTGWSNSQYDKLIQQAQMSNDQTVRMRAMHEAENILMEEMPILPIYHYTLPVLINGKVKNAIHDAIGGIYLKEAYVE